MRTLLNWRQRLGRWGEDIAAAHVVAAGCVLLCRNCRTRFGEVDLLVRDGAETVLIEVKARSSGRCGSGCEAIDRRKRLRMRRLAGYLGLSDARVRFDVIAVERGARGEANVNWLKGAF